MSTFQEERLSMAQAVLRPTQDFYKNQQTGKTTEQKLDQVIKDLETHNEQVRSHILSTGLSAQRTRQGAHRGTPTPAPDPQTTADIIAHLKPPHQDKNRPPPSYIPPPHGWATSGQAADPPTAVSIARDTIQKLEVFDEQARRTLAPYLMERERSRREKVVGVPEAFRRVGGSGMKRQGSGSGEGGKGMVDRSRDPRLRR